MIWDIAKKECLTNIMTFRFTAAFVLVFSLCTSACALLIYGYAEDVSNYLSRVASQRNEVERSTTYSQLIENGVTVHRRPASLSWLVRGLEDSIESIIKVNSDQFPMLTRQSKDNPMLLMFRTVDFLFILKYILSLIAIIFAHDSFTDEKENGTLRLIMSNQLASYKFALGKVAGGFAALAIPILASYLFILLMASVYLTIGGDDLVRLVGILALALGFLLAIYLTGTVVSLLSSSSAASLLVSILAWVIMIIGVPYASESIAKTFFPVPDYTTTDAEIQTSLQVANKNAINKAIMWSLRERAIPTVDIAHGFFREEYNKANARAERLLEAFENAIVNQAQMIWKMEMISPAGPLSHGLLCLSGTGLESNLEFIRSVRRYKSNLFSFLYSVEHKGSPVDAGALPEFKMTRSDVRSDYAKIAFDLAALAIYNIIALAVCIFRFSRYDMR